MLNIFSYSVNWQDGLVIIVLLVACIYAIYTLIHPILVPPILRYPWPYDRQPRDKQRTVAIAGSYNPPHRGHLAMIAHLSERYGRVLVVLGCNPHKRYAVTPDERAGLLRTMVQAYPNVQVHVVSGYIWRFAKPRGVTCFIRGIRSWDRDGADERQLQILNTWGPLLLGPLWWPLPTLFLEGHPAYNHISSTLIRDTCRGGGGGTTSGNNNNAIRLDRATRQKLSTLVPDSIVEKVWEYYGLRQS